MRSVLYPVLLWRRLGLFDSGLRAHLYGRVSNRRNGDSCTVYYGALCNGQ